jgi:hypothetical protein
MIELGDGNATFECVRPSWTIVSAILIPTGPGLITGAGRCAAESETVSMLTAWYPSSSAHSPASTMYMSKTSAS